MIDHYSCIHHSYNNTSFLYVTPKKAFCNTHLYSPAIIIRGHFPSTSFFDLYTICGHEVMVWFSAAFCQVSIKPNFSSSRLSHSILLRNNYSINRLFSPHTLFHTPKKLVNMAMELETWNRFHDILHDCLSQTHEVVFTVFSYQNHCFYFNNNLFGKGV